MSLEGGREGGEGGEGGEGWSERVREGGREGGEGRGGREGRDDCYTFASDTTIFK